MSYSDAGFMGGDVGMEEGALRKIYERALGGKPVTGTIYGGASDTGDVIKEITEYHGSLYSTAKLNLVRNICIALKEELKLPVNCTGTFDEMVASIKSVLPGPKPYGNDTQYKEDKSLLLNVAKKVASIINKETGTIIDTNAGVEVIITKVNEYLSALTNDTFREFAVRIRDVGTIMRNLQISIKFIEDLIKNLDLAAKESMQKSEDPESFNYNAIKTVLDSAITELRRQLSMLEAFIGTAYPSINEPLSKLLSKSKDFKGLIQKIKRVSPLPSGEPLGKHLAYTVNHLGVAAEMAAMVDRALKSLGISVGEYNASKTMGELYDKYTHLMEKAIVNRSSSLKDFPAKLKVLMDVSQYKDSDNFKSELDKLQKVGSYQGGEEPAVKMDKRIKKRQVLRKEIFRAFNHRIRSVIDKVLLTTARISMKIGIDIILTEDLRKFMNALSIVPDIRDKTIYFAISGYNYGIQSKERRERFRSAIKVVVDTLDKLVSVDPLFKDLKAHFEELISIIDNFSNAFETSVEHVIPLADIKIKRPSDSTAEKTGSDEDSLEEILGGDEDDLVPQITKIAYDFNRAITDMKYRHNVSKIYDNFKKVKLEMPYYSEKYEKVLGDAIANERDFLRNALAKRLERIDTKGFGVDEDADLRHFFDILGVPTVGPLYMSVKQLEEDLARRAPTDPSKTRITYQIKKIKEYRKHILTRCEKSENMWRAIEAMDLILKQVTDNIVSDPKQLEDINSMLSRIDIISKWYSDKTGDYLKKYLEDTDKPNNEYDEVISNKKKIYENISVIKNIFNVFDKVGKSVKGIMSITDIYKAVVEYLIYCDIDPYRPLGGIATGVRYIDDDMIRTNVSDLRTHVIYMFQAMVAKIFTVLGTYNMLHNVHPGKNFTKMRMILGGDEDVKTIPEAFELYIRLPLLAEYYRELFKLTNLKVWEGDVDERAGHMITIIPEIDGIYKGLMDIILDKAKYVKEGTYSVIDTKLLISEINKIYSRFREDPNPVNACIQEFIAEINRRIAIVKREYREKYVKEVDKKYDETFADAGEAYKPVDFSILEGEDDPSYPKIMPSDRYIKTGIPNKDLDKKDHKYNIAQKYKYIKALKDRVFDNMKNNKSDIDIYNIIKYKRDEYNSAKTEEAKFDVVRAALMGMGINNDPTKYRNLVLFHETVVTGLTALSTLYSDLRYLKNVIKTIGIAVKLANEYKKTRHDEDRINKLHNKLNTTDIQEIINRVLREYRHSIEPVDYTYIGFNSDVHMSTDVLRDYTEYLALTAEDKKHRTTFLVFLLSIIPYLIKLLSTYDSTKLVNIKVLEDGMVHIDFSVVRDTVEKSLRHIRTQIDKFRGLIDSNIIDKYDKYELNKTSYYFLEKYLLGGLILGRGKTEIDDKRRLKSIDRLNTKLHEILQYAKSPLTFTMNGAVLNDAPASISYGMMFYSVIAANIKEYAHVNKLPSTLLPIAANEDAIRSNGGLINLFINNSGKRIGTTAPGGMLIDITDTIKKTDTNGGAFVTPDFMGNANTVIEPLSSILTVFNKYIVDYLNCFFDMGIRKIYSPLIDNFINGQLSYQIQNLEKANTGYPGANYENASIELPLAALLRVIITTPNANGIGKLYLTNDMAEVALFIKEKIRCQGPLFSKKADYILNYIKHVKNMMYLFDLSMYPTVVIADGKVDTPYREFGVLPDADKIATIKFRNQMFTLLDEIIGGLESIQKMISNVIAELDSSKNILEVYKGSVEEFRSRHGHYPLIGYSNALYIANGYGDSYAHVPMQALSSEMGTTLFKYMYAYRDILLGKDIKLENAPTIKSIINDHNEVSDPRHHFTDKELEEYYNLITKMVHSVYANRAMDFVIGYYSTPRAPLPGPPGPLHTGADPINYGIIVEGSTVYSLRKVNPYMGLEDIIAVMDNENIRLARYDIIYKALLTEKLKTNTREMYRINNLLDINIIPINVNALMREIPLTNLYNYAYTFTHFIDNLFNHKHDDSMGVTGGTEDPTVAIFKKLLKNPDDELVEADILHISKICKGDMGTELGRPKFLADEFWKNWMGQEQIAPPTTKDYSGVAAASAISRSRPSQNLISLYESSMVSDTNIADVGIPILSPEDQRPVMELFKRLDTLKKLLQKLDPRTIDDLAIRATRLTPDVINSLYNRPVLIKDTKEVIELFIKTLKSAPTEINAVMNQIKAAPPTLASIVHNPVTMSLENPIRNRPNLYTYWVDELRMDDRLRNLIRDNKNIGEADMPLTGGKPPATALKPFDHLTDSVKYIYARLRAVGEQVGDHILANPPLYYCQNDDRAKELLAMRQGLHEEIADIYPVTITDGAPKSHNFEYFNRSLPRMLFFLVNIQRILRYKMRKDLTRYDSRVVRSYGVLNPGITELYVNQKDDYDRVGDRPKEK